MFDSPLLCGAVATLKSRESLPNQPDYVVFGSSVGWLVLYGAITFGLKAVGFEILPELVKESEAVLSIARADLSNSIDVDFVCGDMLQADITQAGIIVLTSQCWDTTLTKLVHTKLSAECRRGCVVVDYVAGLDTIPASTFSLCDTVLVPVSWNPKHPFYVFEKVS